MALRAFLFIAGLFGVRLYALLARGMVHEHAPRRNVLRLSSAFFFIAGLFGVRLYALLARGMVHEHAPRRNVLRLSSAFFFIAGLFGVRLYTLLTLRILHQNGPAGNAARQKCAKALSTEGFITLNANACLPNLCLFYALERDCAS